MEVNGKQVKIPEKTIFKFMERLDISKEQAIELWLTDNDYRKNEELEELTRIAKKNRITATIHNASDETKERKKREVVKKENPVKEDLICKFAAMLNEMAENVKIVNASKLIEFEINGNCYKLDLIQKRQPKK